MSYVENQNNASSFSVKKIAVVADHQVSGRGRHDRVWHDEPGSSLLFSILTNVSTESQTALIPWIPGCLTLSVIDVLSERLGIKASAKWPNDILIDDMKVAGVLSQVHFSKEYAAIVVGCGLNLTGATWLENKLENSFTTVERHTFEQLDQISILQEIISAFDERYLHLDWLQDSYRTRCSTLGKTVLVNTEKGRIKGKAKSIDNDFGLVVETSRSDADGGVITLRVGDVTHLRT